MSDLEIEIRPAHVGDISLLIELFTAVVGERVWLGTEPGFDAERLRAGWSRRIPLADHLTLVAADGDRIVGTLGLVPENGRHGLGMLVADGYRGQRIGTQLIDAAVAWAQVNSVAVIALGVFAHNPAAIRLYEKAGFLEVTRRDSRTRQSGEIYKVIEMELPL